MCISLSRILFNELSHFDNHLVTKSVSQSVNSHHDSSNLCGEMKVNHRSVRRYGRFQGSPSPSPSEATHCVNASLKQSNSNYLRPYVNLNGSCLPSNCPPPPNFVPVLSNDVPLNYKSIETPYTKGLGLPKTAQLSLL